MAEGAVWAIVLGGGSQAFRADQLRAAHASGEDGVEDSTMVAALGARVVVVPGDSLNLHVTTPDELALARRLV